MSVPTGPFDIVLLLSVIAASAAGSVHCVGMCGGLMLAGTNRLSESRGGRQNLWRQTYYHLARLVSYMLLGALAGGFGSLIFNSRISIWIPNLAAWAMVAMFLLVGIFLIQGKSGFDRLGHGLATAVGRIFPTTLKLSPNIKPMAVGFLTGLLPCGWLYAFVLSALALQTSLKGMILMASFWLGTVPWLFLFGIGIGSVTDRLRGGLRRFAGGVMIVLALLTLGNKFKNEGPQVHEAPHQAAILPQWICQ